MAKVVDAARVTTPSNTVWRTCIGCSRPKPLPANIDRCDDCEDAADQEALEEGLRTHALTGWEHANRYANTIGRIKAWAVLIPHATDAERLAGIRDVLAALTAGDDKAVS